MRFPMSHDHSRGRAVIMRLAAISSAILLSLASAGQADEEPRRLTLTFGPDLLSVAGIEGRPEIIAFGIGIGSHGHAALLRREVKTAIDDDGDGTVTFNVRKIPTRSVWIVVDTLSGDYTIATPSREAPGVLSFPDEGWRGDQAHVEIERTYLEVLVVRPGPHAGAWTLRSADGGSNDSDGVSDRKIRVRLDRMERLIGAEDQGPAYAIPKDLLFVVDPQTLDLFASEAK
jgi:hypothetical protein